MTPFYGRFEEDLNFQSSTLAGAKFDEGDWDKLPIAQKSVAVKIGNAFSIREISSADDTAVFGLTVDTAQIPSGDDLSSFELTLEYDPAAIGFASDDIVFAQALRGK